MTKHIKIHMSVFVDIRVSKFTLDLVKSIKFFFAIKVMLISRVKFRYAHLFFLGLFLFSSHKFTGVQIRHSAIAKPRHKLYQSRGGV